MQLLWVKCWRLSKTPIQQHLHGGESAVEGDHISPLKSHWQLLKQVRCSCFPGVVSDGPSLAQLHYFLCPLSEGVKWLQRLTNLMRKCLRMRLDFPSAQIQSASETRWFLLSSVMTMVCFPISCTNSMTCWLYDPAVSMATGGKCVSFQVLDTLQSCCLLPVWLPLPAWLHCSSDGTQRKYREQWHPIDFPLAQGIRVAPSGHCHHFW